MEDNPATGVQTGTTTGSPEGVPPPNADFNQEVRPLRDRMFAIGGKMVFPPSPVQPRKPRPVEPDPLETGVPARTTTGSPEGVPPPDADVNQKVRVKRAGPPVASKTKKRSADVVNGVRSDHPPAKVSDLPVADDGPPAATVQDDYSDIFQRKVEVLKPLKKIEKKTRPRKQHAAPQMADMSDSVLLEQEICVDAGDLPQMDVPIPESPHEADKPGRPENLQVSNVDAQQCKLSWSRPTEDGGSDIIGYVVETCEEGGEAWQKAAGIVSGTSLIVSDLKPGKKYKFRVKAENICGLGEPVETDVAVSIKIPLVPCGPPGRPEVDSVSSDSIALHWDEPCNTGNSELQGYIVEMKPSGGDWTEVNVEPVCEPEMVLPGLTEGQEYQFRVRAVNEAGPGTPSTETGPLVAEKPPEKPSIDLSRVNDITVRADENVRITLPIKGWPAPTARWQHSGKDLHKDDRIDIETTDDEASLLVKDVKRTDTGSYSVVLQNASGTAEATVKLTVLDKPSAPQGPLEVMDTTPTAITLRWKPPTDNGGVPVDCYILETKPSGSDEWTKCPVRIGPDETEGTVDDLARGQEYDFRVVAVNSQGQSEPLVTTAPVRAKYPFDPPGKPGEPECEETTEDSVVLSWEPPTETGGKLIKGYIVEQREIGSSEGWTKVTPREMVPDNTVTVDGLTEGKSYEFRVAAVNEAGPGDYVQTKEPIKPSPAPSAPMILVDSLQREITAAVGEPYRIRVPFKGSPTPTATWHNGPEEVMEGDRISFEQLEHETVLVCRSAERFDEGNYTVTLINIKGSDTATICVTTLDKPSRPEGPLDVSKVTPESCSLNWNPPKDNGGMPISHYVVEKKDRRSSKWTLVSGHCRTPECDITGLDEGQKYEFRVAAVNDRGQSEPLVTTKPIIVKHPFDVPGEPGAPMIEDIDEDSVKLSWTPPTSDGGDNIRGYVIETKEKVSDSWKPLNAQSPCEDTTFTARDLETGKEYEFRVLAKNLAGLGKPSHPSEAVVTKPKADAPKAPEVLQASDVDAYNMKLPTEEKDNKSDVTEALLEPKDESVTDALDHSSVTPKSKPPDGDGGNTIQDTVESPTSPRETEATSQPGYLGFRLNPVQSAEVITDNNEPENDGTRVPGFVTEWRRIQEQRRNSRDIGQALNAATPRKNESGQPGFMKEWQQKSVRRRNSRDVGPPSSPASTSELLEFQRLARNLTSRHADNVQVNGRQEE